MSARRRNHFSENFFESRGSNGEVLARSVTLYAYVTIFFSLARDKIEPLERRTSNNDLHTC